MDQTSQPQPVAPAPVQKKSTRTIWAIILLAGPTALLVVTFVAFAIINWTFAASSTDYYTEGPSIVRTILNVVLWLIGAAATVSWLPGIIVGIILLATKPTAPRQ